ncbi:hypothetical protein B0A52_05325 [Exophiala mesophila]|uniref:DNA-directed RNA polymerase n=1 Tax=Exophiala mesophila TaxID=212818 RepID=A0A438N4J9_EXOME|nr:hypothetical protein B0A52_05325 [Exophiala mesophila]
MLTRAARRRHALHHLQRAADNIQLKWLCPALAQPYTTFPPSHPRTSTTRPLAPRSTSTPSQRTQLRHLASPASAHEYFDTPDDYIPFSLGNGEHSLLHTGPRSPLSDLTPFDVSQILMLDNSPEFEDEYALADDPTLRKRGNPDEIEATLDACLHVQQWTRAYTLLSQLCLVRQDDYTRLRNAHNKYLAAIVDDLLQNRNMEHQPRINNWIEGQMKKVGLEPDALSLALRLKVALESFEDPNRLATINRYWNLIQGHQLENEVLSMRNILDDRDLGRLFEVCSFDVEDLPYDVSSTIAIDDASLSPESYQQPTLKIRETDQKGMGLASLKKSLRIFSERVKSEDAATAEQNIATERQARLERDAIEAAMGRWKAEYKQRRKIGAVGGLGVGRLGGLLWVWHESLANKITKELELVRQATETKGIKTTQQNLRADYGPFLASLPPQKMAAMTVIAMMQIFSRAGVAKPIKLVRLVTNLGQSIENEYAASFIHEKKDQLMKDFENAPKGVSQEWKTDMTIHMHKRNAHHSASPFNFKHNWTKVQHAKLGAILCELLFDTAKMDVTRTDPVTNTTRTISQPVFHRSIGYQNGKKIGLVSIQEDFRNVLFTQPAEHLIAKQLPMVCPPRPWTGFYEGGYVHSIQPFLRVKHHETAQKHYAKAAAARGDLDQLFAGIDVLGRTGWRINRNVFNVMLEAWNSGEEVANLPPLNKVFPEIERPEKDASPKDRWLWFSKMRGIENEKSGLHSERCFQNFQMEIAKAFLDETFYLPHNVDFRGRAYPIPPYLNQMGADNCRGLLLFDRGRQLGADGLRWLKIHLANVYGYDKANLDERAAFLTEHLDDVYDSVRNPLDGKRWWLTAEDPWQCLATCFELVGALESPDPAAFVSRLPVHQDGSCNGLQHYAALGGDIAGAKQVNLEPGDRPSDVYTGVCELVKASIKEDIEKGDPVAKLLDGRVTRKVVKQTVMTNVYGVTFLGAMRQVRKQVEALMPDLEAAQVSGRAANYIAKKIFHGLGTLFSGAHHIQYWLGDCANRISSSISPAQLEKIYAQAYGPGKTTVEKSTNRSKKGSKVILESGVFRSSVIWTTPLKLPVVQPYRMVKGQSIQTALQNITLNQPSVADAVNKRKQLQAFPPNFVHSLDATHMVLSALKAEELGISFSAVHDSFWTHAADVNTLNTLLREAFIRMHSEDIIGRLSAEFQMRYQGHYYLAFVKKSHPLSKAIGGYRREMTSKGELPTGGGSKKLAEKRHAELVREVRKQKLMASEDPKERAEGEAMVTAATLFEQYDGEDSLFHRDSLGASAVGAIPEAAEEAGIEEAIQSDLGMSEVEEDDDDLANPLSSFKSSGSSYDGAHDLDNPDLALSFNGPDARLGRVHAKAAIHVGDKPPTSNSKNMTTHTWLWLPLTFRPVPKKGDFDVNRLRESTYFFS